MLIRAIKTVRTAGAGTAGGVVGRWTHEDSVVAWQGVDTTGRSGKGPIRTEGMVSLGEEAAS